MNFLNSHRSLLVYTFLNYIDKCISFVLPLIVLYILKDIPLYNNIEYIFSIANIVVVIADLGIRVFFLYNYRESLVDEHRYLQAVKSYFYLINLLYVFIAAGLLLLSRSSPIISVLVPFICVRSLFVLFTNFYSIYFRLIDRPHLVFLYTISVNVLTILTIAFANKNSFFAENGTLWFFTIQILFVFGFTVNGLAYIRLVVLKELFIYLKRALVYSWPLILNVLVLTFINNYGKIYAYNHMSEEAMFSFSYILRISMIIQMAHASVISYYSKSIYIDQSKSFNYKVYKLYNIFMVVSVFIAVLALLSINALELMPPVAIDLPVVVILVYIFIWGQVAYFEQYLSKHNKNLKILFFAAGSSLVYLTLLYLNKGQTILNIAIAMLSSISINFLAVIAYMRKLSLLK